MGREAGQAGARMFSSFAAIGKSWACRIRPWGRSWRDGSFQNLVKIMEHWDRYETYRWCIGGITREIIRPYTKHYFLGALPVRDTDGYLPAGYYMSNALQLVIEASTSQPLFLCNPGGIRRCH